MGLSEVAEFARNFAAMVRVQGPDPKGMKMRNHAFHHYNSGKTTLSASGMLLPRPLFVAPVADQASSDTDKYSLVRPMVVITVASVIEPFLPLEHRDHMVKDKPKLISGVQIDVMIEKTIECDANMSVKEDLHWLPAELLTLVDVPLSSSALQSLLEATSGPLEHGWEVGWSLTSSYTDGHQASIGATRTEVKHSPVPFVGLRTREESRSPSVISKLATRIAVLLVHSLNFRDMVNLNSPSLIRRGDIILAVGAPFGVLSPVHFFNSLSVGSVANCYPPDSSQKSLLMADIRCLPGMEGCPVFGENADLFGILTRPLKQRSSGAEVQLVIPWEAIAAACSHLFINEPGGTKGIHTNGDLNVLRKRFYVNEVDLYKSSSQVRKHQNFCSTPSPAENATASICLITIDDGAWASGVLLNNDGLILTNAHLFEPWRFRKAAASNENEINSELPFAACDDSVPAIPRIADSSLGYEYTDRSYLNNINRRSIRVRLDHVSPWIWCDARVLHVSRGPLDVALIQLEFVPDKMHPIIMDFSCPNPGSMVYVIGHGLFGPRCDLLPSACLGVVAKVVKAIRTNLYESSIEEKTQVDLPAMIETTAMVHPGASGGAIINSDGHMIGLVTSNARHGGGTLIPHLNFSIPCAALEPVFKFSKDIQNLSLLEELDKPNHHLSSVWALIPPLSPKPDPSQHNLMPLLPGDRNKDAKGSQFAKFISERQDLLKYTSEPGKANTISNKFLPSKL